MIDQEKVLSDMNQGRAAHHTFEALSPVLDEVRIGAVAKLKNMYRAGDATEMKLLACVAELCTIDDIENRFKAKIAKGNRALGVMNGDQ